jgi:hypothetical protein
MIHSALLSRTAESIVRDSLCAVGPRTHRAKAIRSFLRFLVLGLAVLVSVGLAAEPAKPAKPYVESATGLAFPVKLGGMTFGGAHGYGQRELGVSLRYAVDKPDDKAADLWADIYIYDMGQKNIPEGADSDGTRAAFEDARQAILTMEKKGRFKDLKVVIEKPLALKVGEKNLAFLCATFEYTIAPAPDSADAPQAVVSHLFVTGYRGQFLKVRCTYDAASKEAGTKIVKAFMADLGVTLSQKPAGPVT